MAETIYICDKCKMKYNHPLHAFTLENKINKEKITADLCDECYQRIASWITEVKYY